MELERYIIYKDDGLVISSRLRYEYDVRGDDYCSVSYFEMDGSGVAFYDNNYDLLFVFSGGDYTFSVEEKKGYTIYRFS